MTAPAPERRTQLEGWIAETTRNRKRLALACALGAVIAGALFAVNETIAAFALLSVVLVAICGLWITTAHIQDWRYRIREIDHPRPKVSGGGRRF